MFFLPSFFFRPPPSEPTPTIDRGLIAHLCRVPYRLFSSSSLPLPLFLVRVRVLVLYLFLFLIPGNAWPRRGRKGPLSSPVLRRGGFSLVTMPSRGPPSPIQQPAKRQRQSSFDPNVSPRNGEPSPHDHPADGSSSSAAAGAAAAHHPHAVKAGQSSNFRNVSACNRCRLRKNRCDQKLPSCASCAKAGVACVGYDPITKKEIPRRYGPDTLPRMQSVPLAPS